MNEKNVRSKMITCSYIYSSFYFYV